MNDIYWGSGNDECLEAEKVIAGSEEKRLTGMSRFQ